MTNQGAGVTIVSLTIAGLTGALVFVSAARADQNKIDWPVNCKIVQQQSHSLGAPDSVLVAALAKCAMKMPGDPIDGAEVLVSETYVLDKAKGIDHGTISFATDKGSITDAFWGDAKTATIDGQPATRTSGLFKMSVGTGIYAGYSAQGTYAGGFPSNMAFDIEFKGTMGPKKQATQ